MRLEWYREQSVRNASSLVYGVEPPPVDFSSLREAIKPFKTKVFSYMYQQKQK